MESGGLRGLRPPLVVTRLFEADWRNFRSDRPLLEMIDVTFHFWSGTPPGEDPDRFSQTLRRYHQLFCSKPLPGGGLVEVDASGRPPYYLQHRSELLGKFACRARLWYRTSCTWRRSLLSPGGEREALWPGGYTIGASIVFPAQRVGWQADDQRCACFPSEDHGLVRSDGGVHPPA